VARRLRVVGDPQIAEAVRGGALGTTLAAELGRVEHEAIRPLGQARLAQRAHRHSGRSYDADARFCRRPAGAVV